MEAFITRTQSEALNEARAYPMSAYYTPQYEVAKPFNPVTPSDTLSFLGSSDRDGKDEPAVLDAYIQTAIRGTYWQTVNYQTAVKPDTVRLSFMDTSGTPPFKAANLKVDWPSELKSYPLAIQTSNAAAHLTESNSDLYYFTNYSIGTLSFAYIDNLNAEGGYDFQVQ